MRVLYITSSFSKGGASVGSRNTVRALEAVGVDVICIDTSHPSVRFAILKKILRFIERITEHLLINIRIQDAHFIKFGPSTLSIKSLVDYYKPDVVHIGFIAGNVISRRDLININLPLVWRLSDFWGICGPVHYPPSTYTKVKDVLVEKIYKLSEMKLPSNTHIVCPSIWSVDIVKTYGCIPYSSLSFIPNAVDVDRLHSIQVFQSEGHFDLTLVVVAGNLLDVRKGVGKLYERLISESSSLGITIKLNLIGNGGKAFKSSKNLYINSPGHQSRNDTLSYIKSSDFLICPSIKDNSPNVVTEALALGTPCLIHSGSGAASYVKNNITGFHFDFSNNPDTEVDIPILSLLMSVDLPTMKNNAKMEAKKNYSFSSIGRKYKALYKKVLDK